MTARNSQARIILREGYAAGDPVREIAKRAGITYGSARTYAKEMGLEHPSKALRRVPDEKRDEYLFLTRKKYIPAKEALAMLGVEL